MTKEEEEEEEEDEEMIVLFGGKNAASAIAADDEDDDDDDLFCFFDKPEWNKNWENKSYVENFCLENKGGDVFGWNKDEVLEWT